MSKAVTPYPFASLEPISRSAQKAAEAARRRLAGRLDLRTLERVASELAGDEVRLAVRGVKAPPGRLTRSADVRIDLGESGVGLAFAVEPELAVAVLSRLLERPLPFGRVGAPLDETLQGALAALVLETCRRAGITEAPRLTRSSLTTPSAVVQTTVLFQGKPFELEIGISLDGRAAPADASPELGRHAFEIALPVVVGLTLATPEDLRNLAVGSAWMCGGGIWIDASGRGHGVLAAPSADHGVAVELWPDGKTVLRAEQRALALDVEQPMSNSDEGSNALTEAALDAPVVVRIELGAVSLPAREIASLRPGDVIESGRRIAEPVVLRVAGREIARGDLVNVEGELGVRIRKLSAEDPE